jgi:hypothetical protein
LVGDGEGLEKGGLGREWKRREEAGKEREGEMVMSK